MEQIVILDFGSQYTQVIARRVRELNVYSTILRFDTPASEIQKLGVKGIILSGGPSSVYAPKAPLPDPAIFDLGVPVLGICYGVQLMGHFLGGKVEKGTKREYGKGTLTVTRKECPLFRKLPKSLQVWNSHGDKLTRLPKGFTSVATTDNSEYAAIENTAKSYFGIQFHPEVVHSPRGKEILSNYVRGVCGCRPNWTMQNYAEQACEEIRAKVGKEKVILGLSGGVDSSVAAALIHKAIGDQLTCIFVNNGLLRAREAEVVLDSLQSVDDDDTVEECELRSGDIIHLVPLPAREGEKESASAVDGGEVLVSTGLALFLNQGDRLENGVYSSRSTKKVWI